MSKKINRELLQDAVERIIRNRTGKKVQLTLSCDSCVNKNKPFCSLEIRGACKDYTNGKNYQEITGCPATNSYSKG